MPTNLLEAAPPASAPRVAFWHRWANTRLQGAAARCLEIGHAAAVRRWCSRNVCAMLSGVAENDSDDIRKNLRAVNGYWAWRDKRVAESGAANEILKAAGFLVEELVPRSNQQG